MDEFQRAVDDCLGVSLEGNLSQVTDMSKLLYNVDTFNYDLSNWDVSRVTYMTAMFLAARSFNQDLSNWDVSRVTDMQSMFTEASSFQQTLCGSAWVNSKASKVDMFAHSLGSISCGTLCFGNSFVDHFF